MAQNKYLQLLRNSEFAANYDAAVALIEANAPKLDGAPIIVRFTEGEGESAKTHALLGVSYNDSGAVNYVELGGERIKDVKEALEAAIKAATTKVQAKDGDAIVVTESTNETDGSTTYTIDSSALTTQINGIIGVNSKQTEDIASLNDKIGEGFSAESTVAKKIETLEGKVGAIKVVKTTGATQDTYTIEGAAEGSEAIVIDKDKSLISVELGSVVEGVFTPSATGEVIRFVYELTDGTQEQVDINMSHVITEAELGAIATDMAGKGLVAKEGVLSVGQGNYMTVSDDKVDVNLAAVDADLVAEGTKVKEAIDAAQKAGEDEAAKVQSALTAHIATYEAKVSELEAADAALDGRVTTLEDSAHTHANKGVLDGITDDKVAAWDAAETNAKAYADSLKTAIDAYTVNGQSLSDDGAWTVGADHINGTYNVKVDENTTTAITESVQVSIQNIKNELATLNGGVGSIGDQISAAIGDLDAEVSGNSTHVTVKVTEVDGKLTAVEVTDSIVVVSTDKGPEVDGEVTVENAIVEGTDGGAYLSNVWDCGTF